MTCPLKSSSIATQTRALESTTLVGLLIWTYKLQRADTMSGKGLYQGEMAVDDDDLGWRGRDIIEDCGMLGAIIPGTAHQQRYALHPDAEAVHDALIAMSSADWQGALLVRNHARMGSPPNWGDYQILERVEDKRGHPLIDVCDIVTVGGKDEVVRFCPLSPYPPDYLIDLDRAIYSAWFACLARLWNWRRHLRLCRWELTAIGAPEKPWL